VECAGSAGPGGRRGASADTSTIAADRQADHCRFSQRGFDSADQYHDAGARARRRASRAAPTSGCDECADPGAASGSGIDRAKKATRAEIPSGRTGSALAGARCADARSGGSRRGQRLILPIVDVES
jgi:hypothetical protein